MLVDFGLLKDMMTEHIHDVLDHGFIVYEQDFALIDTLEFLESIDDMPDKHKTIKFPYIPTAENIARWCFEQLEPCVKSHFRDNLVLDHVEVWETETSAASYPEVLRT
jgi:6-pyruvoyltetrahydropterin/6-carboxytetrahydropterin synthase